MSFDACTCYCRALQRHADWEQEEMPHSAASHQGRYGSDNIIPPLLLHPSYCHVVQNMLLTVDVAVSPILVIWHLQPFKYGSERTPPHPPPGACSVVLFTVDSLRHSLCWRFVTQPCSLHRYRSYRSLRPFTILLPSLFCTY